MRAIERTVLFSFLLLLPLRLNTAQYLGNGNVKYLVQSGVWNLLVNNNAETIRYDEILKSHFASYPLTYILPVLNEMAVSEDRGTPLNEDKIKALLAHSALVSDSLLGKKQTAENYFFSALTDGIVAYYKYTIKDYLSAFFNGLSALDKFEECLKLDSSFAAAQVAIGTYKYWVSEKTRSISWLPLVSDEREEGIKLLKTGLRKNSVLYHFGLESLIWIYIHQKKFEEANKLALQAVKKYPNSRYFIYALAHSYEKIDKRKSNEYFWRLIKSREKDGISSNYWKALLLHKIAMNDVALGNYEEAKSLCSEILKLNFNEFELNKLGNRLERVERLKESLEGK